MKLSRNNENVVLEVQDQGKGFSAEKLAMIQAQRSGVGMTGMRERVRHLKGNLTLESSEGGTKIQVVLPLSSVL